jgi:hypothetical protein
MGRTRKTTPPTFSFLECSTSKLTSLYFISTSETRRMTLQRRLRICEAERAGQG